MVDNTKYNPWTQFIYDQFKEKVSDMCLNMCLIPLLEHVLKFSF